jgi:hypothetical protein
MARLRATTLVRSVLDGRGHGGMLRRIGMPIRMHTNRTIKNGEHKTYQKT